MDKTYSVSKYLLAVRKLLLSNIPPVWVNGVITQITERGRMVYLSIAEFVEGDVKPVAKLDLCMFAGEFSQMQSRLSNLPIPFVLKEELKVNLFLEPDFYVGSGKFQCKIKNIDPNFTVGELAKTRMAILKKLESERLLRKNKELPFARLPLRVGLVTGETTAAYKDFTTTLEGSGYPFEIVKRYARMQGNETEATVIRALSELESEDIDVVCIVRGGGAKTDLNYFDSEALCRAIANFPRPVLTGIGHQIDESLADRVAYASCITPTDCAKFLIARADAAKRDLSDVIHRIANSASFALSAAKDRLYRSDSRLSVAFGTRVTREKEKLSSMKENLRRIPGRIFEKEREKLKRDLEGLALGSQKIIDLEKAKFQTVEARVLANDPRRILSRGFSYATRGGKALAFAKDIRPGDELSLHFADGSVQATAGERNEKFSAKDLP